MREDSGRLIKISLFILFRFIQILNFKISALIIVCPDVHHETRDPQRRRLSITAHHAMHYSNTTTQRNQTPRKLHLPAAKQGLPVGFSFVAINGGFMRPRT